MDHMVFEDSDLDNMALLEELFQSPSTLTLLGAVLFFLVLYVLFTADNLRKEPPGPRPLPLIGNLLQLDLKRLHLSLCQMSKKYGPVFTIHFGPKKIVVLAGYKTIKEALINFAEEFGDRDISPMFNEYSNGHGIVFANGESWKEMRRFALTNLRDFGMGKRGSEEKIIEEIRYILAVFENFKGKPFETKEVLTYSTSNIISSIIYGSRFDYADPQFQTMVKQANRHVHLLGSPGVQLYNLFPCLGRWHQDRKAFIKCFTFSFEQIKGLIGKLQETLNPEHRRGFVDSFLIRQQKTQEEQGSSYYHDENLLMCVANMFAAGTESTANTLRWGLLLMAKYPHIQDRVQEELDRVIGSRQTRVVDRLNLPYTDAVIHEIQRLADVVPVAQHATSCDVVFHGYHIKKGTAVFPLLTSVMRDESEWESPYTFNPDHFLDDQGRFIKRDALIPFSAGRRACLGEGLARMELFLFFTSLLQKFRFTPPPGVSESDLDLTPVFGFTVSPIPHTLCANVRG